MADRSLINFWLLEARDAVDPTGESPDKQIAWLQTERRKYSAAIKSGDWEVNATAQEGSSAQQRRGVSDRENHDAIVGALRLLGADIGPAGERPGMLIPVFEGITN